jgi:hypothetical protein
MCKCANNYGIKSDYMKCIVELALTTKNCANQNILSITQ